MKIHSLQSRITLFVTVVLTLFLSVSFSWQLYNERRSAYDQMEARAAALADEIGYAFEALTTPGDTFSRQRIVEQTATIPDVKAVGVANRSGLYISHNKQQRIGQPGVADLASVLETESRQTRYKKDEFIITQPLRGEEYLPELGSDVVGAIEVVMDLKPISNRLKRDILSTGAAGLAFVFVLSVALLGVIRHLALKPIEQLQSATQRLTGGDWKVQITSRGAGELSALAESFNFMAHSLETTQRELLKKERLAVIGQLTAVLGHDLRNPLASIRNTVHVIKMRSLPSDEAMKRDTERLERGLTRCETILDEMLDFTRPRQLQPKTVQVDEWLTQVLDEQPVPDGIQLTREMGLPGVAASIDDGRLRRAIVNVLENACQAMQGEAVGPPPKGSKLTVRTRQRDERVEVEIIDTGPGLDPEGLERIFEPLYSTKAKGVGLGMLIVKQAVEQHGGGVEVHSTQGAGARVVLWLPSLGDPGRSDEETEHG